MGKILGVIPARFGSTRLPGKPLQSILDKPLLQWVVEGAKTSEKLDELIVATDHEEILALCKKIDVAAVMTDPDLPSGSDRVWAAAKDRDFDIIINIQGDEPLIEGWVLDELVEPFSTDSGLNMATLGHKMSVEDLESPNTAKIVLNNRDEALYFSRFSIPFSRADLVQYPEACLKHIGLYAYRKEFLKHFCQQAPVDIERCESLEQLRALYLGARLKVIRVEHESWGVDTPDDVKKIEQRLRSRRTDGA